MVDSHRIEWQFVVHLIVTDTRPGEGQLFSHSKLMALSCKHSLGGQDRKRTIPLASSLAAVA